jgi:hypothetical protein
MHSLCLPTHAIPYLYIHFPFSPYPLFIAQKQISLAHLWWSLCSLYLQLDLFHFFLNIYTYKSTSSNDSITTPTIFIPIRIKISVWRTSALLNYPLGGNVCSILFSVHLLISPAPTSLYIRWSSFWKKIC